MSPSINRAVVKKLLLISAVFLLSGHAQAELCSANLSVSEISKANALLDTNHPVKAYGAMLSASDKGSGGSFTFMGNMYEQGRGVAPSPFMTRHMYWMGAQYGDPEAMVRIAEIFYARGLPKDGDFWAKNSMECGNNRALLLLIRRSIDAGDSSTALDLIGQARERSLTEATFLLAEQYDKGGLGLSKDLMSAFKLYYQSAIEGYTPGMNAVGFYFSRGLHGVKDDLAAIHWYHESAKRGDVDGMTAYGWMKATGVGSYVDLDEAMYYLKRAAKAGGGQAISMLQRFQANASLR